jgi:hypothetical protein
MPHHNPGISWRFAPIYRANRRSVSWHEKLTSVTNQLVPWSNILEKVEADELAKKFLTLDGIQRFIIVLITASNWTISSDSWNLSKPSYVPCLSLQLIFVFTQASVSRMVAFLKAFRFYTSIRIIKYEQRSRDNDTLIIRITNRYSYGCKLKVLQRISCCWVLLWIDFYVTPTVLVGIRVLCCLQAVVMFFQLWLSLWSSVLWVQRVSFLLRLV